MTIMMKINENLIFKDNILITGFHGIGTTGFIAIKYITNELDAQKIGTILSEIQPPFITTKDGKISLPFELFKKEENIMLVPQFQPYRHEHKSFAENLVDWTIKSEFKQAILIGGLDARLKKNNDDKIRVIATTAYLENFNNKLPVLEDGLFVTGPLALILTYYEVNKFPAIALLPYAESSRADPLAASYAIEAINEITNLSINTEKLIQDAEIIEKNLEDIIIQTKDQETGDKEQGNRRLYI
ncbi:MAG: proteasome assembly chaperone family protein [Candidatus Heimdallarchaeota archaeon]|nr:proteasome assembly chaperone family protein [Candidatus Heimdallarchaeota archaeon]